LYDELDIKMNKYFMMASQLSLKNYNINSSVSYYEKYVKCIKKAYSGIKEEEKFLQSAEKILEGLKLAADELKKKHNFVKGKENTKKIYDELIAKFVTKVGLEETKADNRILLNTRDLHLLNYMVRNGLVTVEDTLPKTGNIQEVKK
jgi:predicted O-linked N-acetylglucosamine transferase (SPINDLY family)